jgi:hypothetical protein
MIGKASRVAPVEVGVEPPPQVLSMPEEFLISDWVVRGGREEPTTPAIFALEVAEAERVRTLAEMAGQTPEETVARERLHHRGRGNLQPTAVAEAVVTALRMPEALVQGEPAVVETLGTTVLLEPDALGGPTPGVAEEARLQMELTTFKVEPVGLE